MYCFFFSSRRRHTRCSRDWSSDVCSSDLLTRLAAGGFGAFGVIVLVHLRLRALPRADQTLVLEGSREDLTQVADDIAASAVQPAAHELMSPALARRERWLLAVRFAGSAALVSAEETALRAATRRG